MTRENASGFSMTGQILPVIGRKRPFIDFVSQDLAQVN